MYETNFREINKKVIDLVINAGSNASMLHDIEFAFYGNPENLEVAKINLLNMGYFEITDQSDRIDDLIVHKKMQLDLDIISNEVMLMLDIAREHGINYDGWSTYPVLDKIEHENH